MKKTAIITGAAGNMGIALVKKLISENFWIDAGIAPFDKPDFYADTNLNIHQLDLTEEFMAKTFVEQVAKEKGNIDVAILTVGAFAMGNVYETDYALLQKMFKLNFETAYFIARPVFEQMEKQKTGGQIIFVGARPALDAQVGKDMLAYALSKSLLFKLAEFLNAEGKSKNITATVIVPSTIDTPINRSNMPDADFETWVKPEQIADTVAFICSDAGRVLRESVFKIYNNA